MVRIKKKKCTNAHIFACTHKRPYGYAYTHIQAHTHVDIDKVSQLYTTNAPI